LKPCWQIELPGDKNIIGTKVVAIRKEKKIKQKDFLAKLQTIGLDISPTSLSRLEGQYRLVQDFEVVAIAKALEISVSELLGEELQNQ
jgi:transcriptional regulator with XRE-family HTH domain